MIALVLFVVVSAPRGAGATQGECRVVEDFAKAKVGEFPADWEVLKKAGKATYSVQEEGGLRFLRAHSKGLGIQAAKQHAWDLSTYPVMAWSWRAREFPRGAHEKDGKNDSVLAVYMLVPHSRAVGPKAVKYVWSEHVAPGTRLESNKGLTQVRVLRQGTERRGEWVEERVNARDDYAKYFRDTEVPRPAGIAVLTDSDDTRSSAQGDYASVRVCRG